MIIPKESLPNKVPFKPEKLAAMRKVLSKYFKNGNFKPATAQEGLARLKTLSHETYDPKLAKSGPKQKGRQGIRGAKFAGSHASELAIKKAPTIADHEDFDDTIKDIFDCADAVGAYGPVGIAIASALRLIALTMLAVATLDEIAASRPGIEQRLGRGGSAGPDVVLPQDEPIEFFKTPKGLPSPVLGGEDFVGPVKGKADAERILAQQDTSLQEYLHRINDPTSAVAKEKRARDEAATHALAKAMRDTSEARHGTRRLPLKATAADAAEHGRIRRSRGGSGGPKTAPPQETPKIIKDIDATRPTPPASFHKLPPDLKFQKQDDPAGASDNPTTPDLLSATFEPVSSTTSFASFISLLAALLALPDQIIASVVPTTPTRFLSPEELRWYGSCEEMPNFLTLGTLPPLSQALLAGQGGQSGHDSQNSVNAASPADTLPPADNAGLTGNSSHKDMTMQRIFRELHTLGSSFNYAVQG